MKYGTQTELAIDPRIFLAEEFSDTSDVSPYERELPESYLDDTQVVHSHDVLTVTASISGERLGFRPITKYGRSVDEVRGASRDPYHILRRQLFPRLVSLSVMDGDLDVSVKWKSPFEAIVQEVGRLRNGWAGEGSIAPSETVIRNLQFVSSILPPGAKEPHAEVDPDDGSISVIWMTDQRDQSFSLTFFESGRVGGAHAVLDGVALPGWVLPADGLAKVSAYLTHPQILRIVAG